MYLWIGGQEWIIVLIAVIILLIWGPTKLPSLARGVGEAIREFRKAVSGAGERGEKRAAERQEEPDSKVLEMARALGIPVEGKTREQLLDEISKKLSQMRGEVSSSSARQQSAV
jgi:sec-independent protein translocase protein TatA